MRKNITPASLCPQLDCVLWVTEGQQVALQQGHKLVFPAAYNKRYILYKYKQRERERKNGGSGWREEGVKTVVEKVLNYYLDKCFYRLN